MRQKSRQMKPKAVIFSSSDEYSIAEGVYQNLQQHHDVVLWRQFFGENSTTPLWTFFKNLFQYDYAILILSPDSIVWDQVTGNVKGYIPKDNVIFELGATMARLGPQKTILVSPDKPDLNDPSKTVQLPSYFDDVKPLHFTYTRLDNYTPEDKLKATQSASEGIKKILDAVTFDNFHSELPAQGLAQGYLKNFVKPTFAPPRGPKPKTESEIITWTPELAINLVIVIPENIFDVKSVKSYFEKYPAIQHATLLKQGESRDIGIYMLPRKNERDPLHIFDIPTTLHTAEHFVNQIERFWRDKDRERVLVQDDEFIRQLIDREITNFSRILAYEIEKENTPDKPRSPHITIIRGSELGEYLTRLSG